MSIENFKDPRGEYKRICPYCLEPFIATHMNRFYCPEKNGVKNFCKHRQKRLVSELKESGIEIERPKRPPLKLLFEPSDKDFRNIDEGIKETLLNRKIKILEKVLGESESKDIAWDELENLGFTLDTTDEFTLNEFGTQSPTYGKIQLIRHEGNIMKIKKLK
ncbi:MAG: hypothetical protein FGM14_15535 [Flavobacteriales bacterium]|nr:hypothetical protein [Flavobacteriales bacterium]